VQHITPTLIIASVVSILYFPTLFFSVIVDDIRQYQKIKDGLFLPFKLKTFINSIGIRLYGGGTFAYKRACWVCKGKDENCANCKGSGLAWSINTIYDHGFTLFLHATICVLIYFALGRNQISFWAAILYAVNPANNQTSMWLNGRRYALTIILTLLAALTPPFGMLFFLLTPLFYFSSLFTPVLYGWEYLIAVPALLFVFRNKIISFYNNRMRSIANNDMKTMHIGRVTVFVKNFGFYLIKMALPGRTMMCYPFLSDWGMTKEGNRKAYAIDFNFIVGAIGLAASVYGMVVLPKPHNLYLAMAALTTAQWCSVQTATQLAADRYISLPNVFAMVLLSAGIFHFFGNNAYIPIAALLAYYVANLFVSMKMYRSMEDYYDYHEYFYPQNTIVRKFKINWLLKSGDVLGGWDQVRKGLVYNPSDFALLYQAAVATNLMGEYKMSNFYLGKAEENHYINQQGLWDKTIDELRTNNNQKLSPAKKFHIKKEEFARGVK